MLRNANICRLDEDICTKFPKTMQDGCQERTISPKALSEVNSHDVIKRNQTNFRARNAYGSLSLHVNLELCNTTHLVEYMQVPLLSQRGLAMLRVCQQLASIVQ